MLGQMVTLRGFFEVCPCQGHRSSCPSCSFTHPTFQVLKTKILGLYQCPSHSHAAHHPISSITAGSSFSYLSNQIISTPSMAVTRPKHHLPLGLLPRTSLLVSLLLPLPLYNLFSTQMQDNLLICTSDVVTFLEHSRAQRTLPSSLEQSLKSFLWPIQSVPIFASSSIFLRSLKKRIGRRLQRKEITY